MPVFFEVHIQTSNAVLPCLARLWNITDGIEVAGSRVSTTSLSAVRVRSASITLDLVAKDYRAEYGGQTAAAFYTMSTADLIFGG